MVCRPGRMRGGGGENDERRQVEAIGVEREMLDPAHFVQSWSEELT